MENKEMKDRFNERFNRMVHYHRGEVLIQDSNGNFPIAKDENGNFTVNQFDAIKDFIQSEKDLAVAKRENEIVKFCDDEIDYVQNHSSGNYADGQVESLLKVKRHLSLITKHK